MTTLIISMNSVFDQNRNENDIVSSHTVIRSGREMPSSISDNAILRTTDNLHTDNQYNDKNY